MLHEVCFDNIMIINGLDEMVIIKRIFQRNGNMLM